MLFRGVGFPFGAFLPRRKGVFGGAKGAGLAVNRNTEMILQEETEETEIPLVESKTGAAAVRLTGEEAVCTITSFRYRARRHSIFAARSR